MRLGGIGTGPNANSMTNQHVDAHQVTNCVHNHTAELPVGMRMEAKTADASQPQRTSSMSDTGEIGVTLASWVLHPFRNTKRVLGEFWNGKETAGNVANGNGSLTVDVGSAGLSSANAVAAAATGLQSNADLQNNPYFSAVADTGKQSENIWQKVKVKFHNITHFLAKKFSFSNDSSFQTKQEQQPKEDLRKKSLYKKDELEIDCVLTDDSYLMDSYNRKGEYSKLSTRK